jgi:hypothetical protein
VHDGAPDQAKGRGPITMVGTYLGSRTVRTDERGRFFFGDLAPGSYTLTYEAVEQGVEVREGVDAGPDRAAAMTRPASGDSRRPGAVRC